MIAHARITVPPDVAPAAADLPRSQRRWMQDNTDRAMSLPLADVRPS